VQTCIWSSWCHCHSLSLASVKSRLVLPFWYRPTWVVPEKGPLNGCVCVCVYLVSWLHNIKFKIVNFLRNYIKNVFLKHSDTGQLTQKLKDKKNWYIHLAVARTEVQHQVGLQGAMRMTQDQLPAENQAKCISQHLQLRTGGFCWCKVLLPACPCWRQPVHSY